MQPGEIPLLQIAVYCRGTWTSDGWTILDILLLSSLLRGREGQAVLLFVTLLEAGDTREKIKETARLKLCREQTGCCGGQVNSSGIFG